jgi:hypothetical protein
VPEHVQEQEEIDAARAWLRHVEAGRIGRIDDLAPIELGSCAR